MWCLTATTEVTEYTPTRRADSPVPSRGDKNHGCASPCTGFQKPSPGGELSASLCNIVGLHHASEMPLCWDLHPTCVACMARKHYSNQISR